MVWRNEILYVGIFFFKEKREDFNTLNPSIYGIWYFNIFILL